MKQRTNRNAARDAWNADATVAAVAHVAWIAEDQRRIATIMNEAAAKVHEIEKGIHDSAAKIKRWIETQDADAGVIAKELAKHRVRTGDLNSRLVDAFERRGQRVYPTPYTPIEMPWALVDNTY